MHIQRLKRILGRTISSREGLSLLLVCRDKHGRIEWTHRQKLHSYVIGWISLTAVEMSAATIVIKDTAGNNQSVTNATNLVMTAAVGNSNYGIQVGQGSPVPGPSDNKLLSPITSGTGAGQLSYSGHSFGMPTVAGGQAFVTITRTFTNGSSGAVTVNEIGIICFADSAYYILVVHDVISPGQVVNPASTLTATITRSVTT